MPYSWNFFVWFVLNKDYLAIGGSQGDRKKRCMYIDRQWGKGGEREKKKKKEKKEQQSKSNSYP